MGDAFTTIKFHPYMLLVRGARKWLLDLYPSWKLSLNQRYRNALTSDFASCRTVAETIAFTQNHMGAGSCQIATEIESAIAYMATLKPKVLCEIGTFQGGTSTLFSKFLPTLETMICVDLHVRNKSILNLLAPGQLKITYVDAPSNSDRALTAVATALDDRKIDVLFIDGDHRYEGAKQDFTTFSKLVRNGGLVLFHDIMPDHGGSAWSGGVPTLWGELSKLYPHTEFVHNRSQAGFGIGALQVND